MTLLPGAITGRDGHVGCGEIEGGDLGRFHPPDCDMLVELRLGTVGGQAADEWNHCDGHPIVAMRRTGQGADDRDFAAEFLVKFADQGGGGPFAGFHFSAWKLPFEREGFVRGPLGDEDASIPLDEGANDRNGE